MAKYPNYKKKIMTIMDHKEKFPNKIEYRLLNPTTSFFVKYYKDLIDKTNLTIGKHSKLNKKIQIM